MRDGGLIITTSSIAGVKTPFTGTVRLCLVRAQLAVYAAQFLGTPRFGRPKRARKEMLPHWQTYRPVHRELADSLHCGRQFNRVVPLEGE